MLVRKSWGKGPIRFTLARRGVGTSVGGRWWRLQTSGSPRLTLRLPGTGLSLKRMLRRR
jgi:hypothetical protein